MKQAQSTGPIGHFESLGKKLDHETLRVDQGKRRVTGQFGIIKFVDKDTNQIVLFMPALDISGYGETEEKASELLRTSMDELSRYLLNLSVKELKTALRNSGWEPLQMKNKEFSRAFIDENGELQNLNAVENSIERLSVSLAA